MANSTGGGSDFWVCLKSTVTTEAAAVASLLNASTNTIEEERTQSTESPTGTMSTEEDRGRLTEFALAATARSCVGGPKSLWERNSPPEL
eukprot:CAMPEP_0184292150 /NCGR_PEP_ID=MMETSP1049-20130417/3990_1 /TAXON_ID=77928 /ORGANISM="Proteomonas sulcata, Strain CCMP704" /LENGTH=89 /DNA_ID=CAMNT_0026599825 /DNA_START=966 /DNA_END=1235 /DNA_ORIENTATION=+